MRISDWSSDVCSSDLTQAGAFKALPADVRDTRVMCYTLSTVLLQIFAASEIAPDPRAATYVKMNGQLEHLLNSEVYPAEDDAHMGEIAMRALAKGARLGPPVDVRSEEHTSELQSLMRISYAVFCLKKKKNHMTQ